MNRERSVRPSKPQCGKRKKKACAKKKEETAGVNCLDIDRRRKKGRNAREQKENTLKDREREVCKNTIGFLTFKKG